MNPYACLLHPPPLQLNEDKKSYQVVKERHLHVLWYEQQGFSELKTKDGKGLNVISPGIWNAGSGPDFLKASIEVDGRRLEGDIEIDFSDDLWRHHGHDRDERYNQVVLHLSLWHRKETSIHTLNGKTVLCAYLEDYLKAPIFELISRMDLDLYPYKQFLGSGYCSQALFANLNSEQVRNFFFSAAEWRLERKYSSLSLQATSNSEIWAYGLAKALGYRDNSQIFGDLFRLLSPLRDEPEDTLLAIAMGTCGYFEDSYIPKWKESVYYQELLCLWLNYLPEAEEQYQLKKDRIRPLNHPIRRMVLLVKLLKGNLIDHLFEKLSSTWEYIEHFRTPEQCLKAMMETFPPLSDPHWTTHYLFEMNDKEQNLPLWGKELQMHILINAFFPILYHRIKDNEEEKNNFIKFYHTLKGPLSAKSRYLNHRFFGEGKYLESRPSLSFQQGTYQLHHDFCVHYEASCEGCPFVQRYHESNTIQAK
ncbi:MAG: DUF2851 family protein [Chlamydiales bacterium]